MSRNDRLFDKLKNMKDGQRLSFRGRIKASEVKEGMAVSTDRQTFPVTSVEVGDGTVKIEVTNGENPETMQLPAEEPVEVVMPGPPPPAEPTTPKEMYAPEDTELVPSEEEDKDKDKDEDRERDK